MLHVYVLQLCVTIVCTSGFSPPCPPVYLRHMQGLLGRAALESVLLDEGILAAGQTMAASLTQVGMSRLVMLLMTVM